MLILIMAYNEMFLSLDFYATEWYRCLPIGTASLGAFGATRRARDFVPDAEEKNEGSNPHISCGGGLGEF